MVEFLPWAPLLAAYCEELYHVQYHEPAKKLVHFFTWQIFFWCFYKFVKYSPFFGKSPAFFVTGRYSGQIFDFSSQKPKTQSKNIHKHQHNDDGHDHHQHQQQRQHQQHQDHHLLYTGQLLPVSATWKPQILVHILVSTENWKLILLFNCQSNSNLFCSSLICCFVLSIFAWNWSRAWSSENKMLGRQQTLDMK